VATHATRNANEAMVGSDGVFVWRKTGVWIQAIGFMLVRMASFFKKFYKFCTSNAIFKDDDDDHQWIYSPCKDLGRLTREVS
jgi:hypothetical protein